MIILHAIWASDATLKIWGEDSALPARSPKRKPLRSKAKTPPPHPFASDIEWLREGVSQINPAMDNTSESGLTLLLPSVGDAPVSSPYMFRDEEIATGDKIRLASWSVPALALAPLEALDFLLSLTTGNPPGILIGESLRFFAEAAKLSLELVARGRAIPEMVKRDRQFIAVWRAVADNEDDAQRVRSLARAMPASCRAESIDGDMKGRIPSDILNDLIERIVDAEIRRSLGDNPLVAEPRRRAKKRDAGHAWLAALTSRDGAIDADEGELIKLQKQIVEWGRSAISASQASLRTCFRLSEPTGEGKKADDSWRMEFLLQATDDKSLLVPADVVWKTKGRALTFSTRKLENPQEKLLGDLGRASRLYPQIETALKTAKPAVMKLDASGAYGFLREAAPLLEQSGFGVLVPVWWKKPASRLGVKLKTKPQSKKIISSGLLGLDSIVEYEWQIALGDEELSFEDFMKLASLKVPLVKVRGQWVELKPEEIEAALDFFKKRHQAGEMTAGEAMRMGLGLGASEVGLPVTGVEAEGWIKNILGDDGRQSLKSVKTPAGFVGSLRPYQERGLSWLSFLNGLGLGACLADDMGLGKTIQLLALLVAERQIEGRKKTSQPGPTLLVCPMSVVGNWQREAARFAPRLRLYVHHGTERLSGNKFAAVVRKNDLVITTYALAARDRKLFEDIEWARIALDEAQNIKNPSAKQTQAVRSFKTSRRVALTGTPVENRLSELWSIMQFLNPGLLGSASDFHTRFAAPIERYRDEEKAALLKRLTGPFILRRLKTDKSIIRDLPDKIEMKTFCNLTKEQASLYQAVVEEMMEKVEQSEDMARRGAVLSGLMKLKQVCNHPAHLLQDGSSLENRSGKLARLEEIFEEILAEGDRALCFTQFAEMGHMLKSHLQERFGREALFLHGGTGRKARDQMVERFQRQDGPPIFLLSLKAGGTGLNLTAAQHVIHFDRWWNPAVEDQATDRAFRIGQKRNVQVRKFVCVGTLEEKIDQMIEQKKELAERIVGAGEAWLTELSTARLREMVALSTDAVSEG